jgi:hypothetical protein
MTLTSAGTGYLERPRSSGLAEVVDLILDKGLVIDVFLRVSLLGLELLTVDARIVVASVDTYLRYAEAVDRLVLPPASSTGITELAGELQESGAKGKTKGGVGGAIEGAKESLGIESDEDENGQAKRGGTPERPRSRTGRSGR